MRCLDIGTNAMKEIEGCWWGEHKRVASTVMVREGFLEVAREGDLRGESAVQAGRLSRLKAHRWRGLGRAKGQRGGLRGCSLTGAGRQGREEGHTHRRR